MTSVCHTSDGATLTVSLSRYRDAHDVIPRSVEVTYPDLVRLLAPARPPVRSDLVREARRREDTLDELVSTVLSGGPPPRRAASSRWFRTLERLAWTAPSPEAAHEAVLDKAKQLREGVRRQLKLRLPCWSPAVYAPGSTRGEAGVVAVSCLVLDFDDGTSIPEAIGPWSDWPLLVHTSWSHTPDHPRFRVVLVLDEPVPAVAWKAAWQWAHERSGGHIDPACKDPSRLYVLPAVPDANAPFTALDHDPGGHLLRIDWERLPQDTQVPQPRSRRPVPAPRDPSRRQARRLLQGDRATRERAAQFLGAEVRARRAESVTCPACRRPSVWFWLEPGPQATAQCQHRNSCGWWGHLDELLDLRGGPDAG